jgi:asparagine N-glycosylation enzyme membrane subunit Stt3
MRQRSVSPALLGPLWFPNDDWPMKADFRTRNNPMMSLPFFAAFVAMAAAWAGWRTVAMAMWALTVVMVVILFRLHATDALDIQL